MSEYRFSDAQADMRAGYLHGAPGVAASSAAWLVSAGVAASGSPSTAVWTLLVTGAFIHPVGVLITKALGSSGAHKVGNPLARLAMESTLWMLAGIAIAVGISVIRIEWFFPAMLLIIGGRYLTFQTVYGLRAFWVLGATLCAVGISLALVRAPVTVSALAGGLIEAAFACLIFARAKRIAA